MGVGKEAEMKQVAQTPNTVTIEIPEGMTQGEFLKAMKSFEDQRLKAKKIARADGRALKRLRDARKEELLRYRREEWKKEGLDPSNLK
jgi:hypothetical protein